MDASTAHPRFRILAALLAACLVLVLGPAAAAGADTGAGPKKDLKVHAKVDKDVVKVKEKVKVKGGLDVRADARGDGARGLEPIIVQSLRAGAWVNLTTSSCRPNGKFNLSLSFHLSAHLTLRVYHPETQVYAAAHSEVFTLAVV
ncbi:hypothetical protein [Qaidamihabitans albus]|uniref:hypothetical protein n=1 Tax=Qaidamihabitans albus TaxID=2795733 RepID=UPI001F3C43F1|nr:hypothetical protein [Qaidamihabitans albus]